MNFNEYQDATALTYKFSTSDLSGLPYLTIGLCGEAGEVAENVKKSLWHNKHYDSWDLGYELGDVLWYLARIAAVAGYSLQEIADRNISKLAARHGIKES